MRNPFQPGDTQTLHVRVTPDKLARFESGVVHPVYSTFALGQDAEWACRQFVLEMTEDDEEGVGSFLSIEHLAPAVQGQQVQITATLTEVANNRIRCRWEAHERDRLIARGEQEQRIITKSSFDRLLASLR